MEIKEKSSQKRDKYIPKSFRKTPARTEDRRKAKKMEETRPSLISSDVEDMEIDEDESALHATVFVLQQIQHWIAADAVAGEFLLEWSGSRITAKSPETVKAVLEVCIVYLESTNSDTDTDTDDDSTKNLELAIGIVANLILEECISQPGVVMQTSPALFASLMTIASTNSDPYILTAVMRCFSNATFGIAFVDSLLSHAAILAEVLTAIITNSLHGDLLCQTLNFVNYVLCHDTCDRLLHNLVLAGWNPLSDVLKALSDVDHMEFVDALVNATSNNGTTNSGIVSLMKMIESVITHHEDCNHASSCNMYQCAIQLQQHPSSPVQKVGTESLLPTQNHDTVASSAGLSPNATSNNIPETSLLDTLLTRCLSLLCNVEIYAECTFEDKLSIISVLSLITTHFNKFCKEKEQCKNNYVHYDIVISKIIHSNHGAVNIINILMEIWLDVLLTQKQPLIEEVGVVLSSMLVIVKIHQQQQQESAASSSSASSSSSSSSSSLSTNLGDKWYSQTSLTSFLEVLCDTSTRHWLQRMQQLPLSPQQSPSQHSRKQPTEGQPQPQPPPPPPASPQSQSQHQLPISPSLFPWSKYALQLIHWLLIFEQNNNPLLVETTGNSPGSTIKQLLKAIDLFK